MKTEALLARFDELKEDVAAGRRTLRKGQTLFDLWCEEARKGSSIERGERQKPHSPTEEACRPERRQRGGAARRGQ
jgi:hypothetical protein